MFKDIALIPFSLNEDTISLLNRYIQESEVDLDKSVITEILQDVYREACEVE